MDNRKKQPFIISRLSATKQPASQTDNALSSSTDELNTPALPKQNSFLSRQSSFTFHDSAFKSHYNIFRTDPSIMIDLLERYSQDNLKYRDEDFTQQAEVFITKIAAEKRIPKELRARFPLYQILLSICKIFMLNEYEIVVFACSLDHCNWKIEEVVMLEEAENLKEFPSNFGVEISDECKMFIMYLLIITFSLKQYLNEKNNVDKIQAYCEKICDNFQTLFNRWTKLSSFQKFNYSAPEINRKFKHLSKKDQDENITSIKDYNMIVDNIMTLTGSYSSKPKVDLKPTPTSQQTTSTTAPVTTPPAANSSSTQQAPPKLSILSGLSSHSIIEPKPIIFHPTPLPTTQEASKGNTLDFNNEGGLKIPSVVGGLGRVNSGPSVLPAFPVLKRTNTFELMDELNRKILKKDSVVFSGGIFSSRESATNDTSSGTESLRQSFVRREETEGSERIIPSLSGFFKHGAFDELGIPGLSKRSSLASQQPLDELPLVPNLNSN